MDDPKPQDHPQHPDHPNGEEHAQAESTDLDEPTCRFPLLVRMLRGIRKYATEIMALCAILAVLTPIIAPLIKGATPVPEPPDETVVLVASPLNFTAQVKRTGVQTWGSLVVMPEDGGAVVFGMRLENTGPAPITGLVARATLPTFFNLVAGACRYGVDHTAETACEGSVLDDAGVTLPDLRPGSWLHLVFVATISSDAPGSTYPAALRVTSDQTGEVKKNTEVQVAATEAEKAVRGLFSQTEDEIGFWGGPPKMAPRSKRLLIAQQPEFTLEHTHGYTRIPGGRSVKLADLFYEHFLEGQVVEVRARIVGRPWDLSRKNAIVKQSYEVRAKGEGPRLRCYTPRPVDQLLEEGDEIEIKAIPIAWSPPGSGTELTMAVCPAARVVKRDDQREPVAEP
jgi:hypothetical protein